MKNYYLRIILKLFLFSLLVFIIGNPAYADGLIIPQKDKIIPIIREIPNFSVKDHFVDIKINDQFVETKIDQTFVNNTNITLEGIYIFPIPENALISKFSMYMNGNKINGKIYTKEEARKIYNDIVSQRKDPALLEYFKRGFFKASVFPIPPNGNVKTEIQYEQLLKSDNNLNKYVYSLDTEKFSNKSLEQVALTAKIKTKNPLKSIYSPTHNIKITRINNFEAIVSYEEKNTKPDREFILYYSTSKKDIETNLLTYEDIHEEKFYLLILSPKYEVLNNEILPKDIVFIIDISGSMSGEKIKQAKAALKFCVERLNVKDKFNIVSFSDSVDVFKDELIYANNANKKTALRFIDKLSAGGGTNIDSALDKGLNFTYDKYKNSTVLFLTDGQPTVGVRDTNIILKNLKKYNKKEAKVFVFGVGFDVNIQFLDKMSLENGGYSEYVRPEESIEVSVASLFEKINMPVLTDISVSYSNIRTFDIFPKDLPDMFKGSQIIVLGKYDKEKVSKVFVKGNISGKKKEFSYNLDFKSSEENDFIPRLWASRKIGYLLEEVRLHGQNKELIDEIVKLSKKYGIVTEFTSFLVREDVDINNAPAFYRDEVKKQLDEANEANKGSWAISQSRNSTKLKSQASQPQTKYINKSGKEIDIQNIKNISNKTFYQKNGEWIDESFEKKNVIEIKIFSSAYFEIASKIKDIEKYLSLGDKVYININGQNIIIGENGKKDLNKEDKRILGL